MVKNMNKIAFIRTGGQTGVDRAALDFAKELDAKIINISGGGHFNSNAGYDKFPQLLSQIKG